MKDLKYIWFYFVSEWNIWGHLPPFLIVPPFDWIAPPPHHKLGFKYKYKYKYKYKNKYKNKYKYKYKYKYDYKYI